MRSFIIVIVLVLFIGNGSWAQPSKNTWEISLSPRFISVKEKGADESTEAFNLPVSVGYFVTENLELEPQFWLTIPDESEYTGSSFLVNLVWNFNNQLKMVPFVLAGIGYGNGIQFMDVAYDQDMNILAINAGAGFKYFLSPQVALRAEYRFRRYSGSKDETSYYGGNYTREIKTTVHDFLLGFSVFFGGKKK